VPIAPYVGRRIVSLRQSIGGRESKSGVVPKLVVIVGPIASGKSTVADALGHRFRDADRSVAVLDLDDCVATIGGFADLSPDRWLRAQMVYGEIVGAWLKQGFDVIAHGPFFERQENQALLHAVPAGVEPRRALLLATYEAALQRVALDHARAVSKDPQVLRLAYDRAASLLPTMPHCEWTFDTTKMSGEAVVDDLSAVLLTDLTD
jgi:hypothetical protein